MKKRKLVRLIALCLIALLIISACATNDDPAPTPPPADGQVTPPDTGNQGTPAAPGGWASRETIDVTIGFMGVPTFGEYGYLNDPLTEMLNEMFNIRIYAIDARDESDWTTLFSGMVATGDIPDIFPAVDESLRQLVEANALLDINRYISSELTPVFYSDNLFQTAALLRAAENGWGDSLFAVPLVKGTHDAGGPLVGDYIRWDLYAELGYPEVRTHNDLLDVLEQMQALRPTTHDGQRAYAVSAWWGDGMGWGDWTLMFYQYFNSERSPFWPHPFLNAMNKATLEIFPTNQLLDDNGVFWRAIDFYNQAHQRGILDPESFIQDFGAWAGKLENGQIYHVLPGWMPFEAQRAYDELGFPEWGFGHLSGVGSTVQSLIMSMTAGERIVSVNANTEDPERIVALLDYMSSYEFSRYAWNGIEGVYWEMINGLPSPKPEFNDPDITEDTRKANSGAHIWNLMCGFGGATVDPALGEMLWLRHHPISVDETMSIVQRDILRHYGVDTLIDAYKQNLTVYTFINPYAPPPYPDDLNFEQANLADFVFRNIFTVIRTNTPEDYAAAKAQFKNDLMQFRINDMFDFQYQALIGQQDFAQQVLDLFHGR